jgi:hypothetical protein
MAALNAESRLPVGPRSHEVVPSARTEEKRAEADYQIPALIFKGHRRHRYEGVVRQKGHQRTQIRGLPGVRKFGDDCVLGGRVARGRRLAVNSR